MKNLSSLLLAGALLGLGASNSQALAQDLYNSGGTITLTGGINLYVSGNLTNTAGGTISTPGSTVRVDGNMVNNAVGGASTYDIGTAGNLEVRGNLTNSSTVSPGTGTVTMAGTTGAQTLDLGGGQVYNLTINNTSGSNKRVDVASDVTVNNVLTLTSGMMKTTPSTSVILPDGATMSGGEAAGRYVSGNLRVTRNGVSGASPIVFPNGVSITPNASLGNLTITRTAGLQDDQTSYGTDASGTKKGIDRIWQFSTTPGSASSLTFTWNSDDDNGAASFTSSRVWARTAAPVAGQDWSAVSTSQNASSRSITSPGGAFSFWTVSSDAAPLPVELLSFNALRVGDVAKLDWRTASEKNNDHWDVQMSTNGRDFRTFAEVAGHGTTSSPSTYTLNDPALLGYHADPVYYRLRQVDTNGTETFSPVRAVRVDAKAFSAVAYPNPIGLDGTSIEIMTGEAGIAALAIYDATGRMLSGVKTELAAGRNTVLMPQAGKLATGAYFLKINQGKQHTMLKLVRQ